MELPGACSRYAHSLVTRVPWSVCGAAVGYGAAGGVYGKDC